jgi:hypothetical protein
VSLEDSFSKLVGVLMQHPLVVATDVISEQIVNAEGYIRLIAKFISGNELHVFEYRVVDDVQKYAYHLQTGGDS